MLSILIIDVTNAIPSILIMLKQRRYYILRALRFQVICILLFIICMGTNQCCDNSGKIKKGIFFCLHTSYRKEKIGVIWQFLFTTCQPILLIRVRQNLINNSFVSKTTAIISYCRHKVFALNNTYNSTCISAPFLLIITGKRIAGRSWSKCNCWYHLVVFEPFF